MACSWLSPCIRLLTVALYVFSMSLLIVSRVLFLDSWLFCKQSLFILKAQNVLFWIFVHYWIIFAVIFSAFYNYNSIFVNEGQNLLKTEVWSRSPPELQPVLCCAPCISCWLTDTELCCQGLNSSCKRPAAPCHAPLLPRWLRGIPAALRRSAHEESVMEWLSETPGSIPHCTAATLLRLSNPRAARPNQGRAACVALFANLPMGGSTDGAVCSTDQQPGGESWREHMPCLAWDATDISQKELSLALSRWPAEVWQALLNSETV